MKITQQTNKFGCTSDAQITMCPIHNAKVQYVHVNSLLPDTFFAVQVFLTTALRTSPDCLDNETMCSPAGLLKLSPEKYVLSLVHAIRMCLKENHLHTILVYIK